MTAYPFSSNILMSAEAMYPFPPVTHAVFFLLPPAGAADIAVAQWPSHTTSTVLATGLATVPQNKFGPRFGERARILIVERMRVSGCCIAFDPFIGDPAIWMAFTHCIVWFGEIRRYGWRSSIQCGRTLTVTTWPGKQLTSNLHIWRTVDHTF